MTKYRIKHQYLPKPLVRIERKQGLKWCWVASVEPEQAEETFEKIVKADQKAELKAVEMQSKL